MRPSLAITLCDSRHRRDHHQRLAIIIGVLMKPAKCFASPSTVSRWASKVGLSQLEKRQAKLRAVKREIKRKLSQIGKEISDLENTTAFTGRIVSMGPLLRGQAWR